MIKKTTKATFVDGGYKGSYDWEGGIPLSEGETLTVITTADEQIVYSMTNKTVTLIDKGKDQSVHIDYVMATRSSQM